jgi:hypothetical protein
LDVIKEDQIALYLPVELGARILSKPQIKAKIAALAGTETVTIGREDPGGGLTLSLPSEAVMLLGAAGTAAAIHGFFNLLNTIIAEIYAGRRQAKQHSHELGVIALKSEEANLVLDLREHTEEAAKRQLEILKEKIAKSRQ